MLSSVRDCLRTYFFAESRCTLSIWPFVSPRKYATMPSFVRAVYRRCLPNKSLYRSLCLCSCAARGTNPLNDTPSWERNYGIAPPVRDTKGHQVGGNGDAKYSGETRAGRGGRLLPLRPRCPVSIQTRLIVRDSHHTSRRIDGSFSLRSG